MVHYINLSDPSFTKMPLAKRVTRSGKISKKTMTIINRDGKRLNWQKRKGDIEVIKWGQESQMTNCIRWHDKGEGLALRCLASS